MEPVATVVGSKGPAGHNTGPNNTQGTCSTTEPVELNINLSPKALNNNNAVCDASRRTSIRDSDVYSSFNRTHSTPSRVGRTTEIRLGPNCNYFATKLSQGSVKSWSGDVSTNCCTLGARVVTPVVSL
jgi:hypothetical protein